MKTSIVSAHNPMTGPRHLGHYLSTMIDWADLQREHELFIIVDDLISTILYPKARKDIANRSFMTVKEFMSTGINLEKNNIVLTSMLPEAHELACFTSLVIDDAWCERLYNESFAGQLSSYQRTELSLPNLPSAGEKIYPQIHLAALTLGLKADYFQGGEEMRGYIGIMDEISNKFKKITKAPVFMEGRCTFVAGTDGHHMASENALYLSSSEKEIKKCLADTQSPSIFKQWSKDFRDEKLQTALNKNEEQEAYIDNSQKLMSQFFTNELAKFRDSSITNKEIVNMLEKSSLIARERLKETLIDVKNKFGIPGF